MGGVANIETKALTEELATSTTPVLVDLWAEWCGPCRMLAPVLEEVAQEIGQRVKIFKINIQDDPGFAQQYGITTIPTLMLFEKGQIKKKHVGLITKEKLMQWLN